MTREPRPDRDAIPASCGSVGDCPWGVTLGTFALRGATGQLTLHGDDGKSYSVAFIRGAVVGASSPVTADSVARIALTGHLASSTQVPAIARAIAAAPGRDEVVVVAETAHLTAEQTARLRRRVLTQRAARTFAVDGGSLVFEERITLSVVQEIAIDVGAAIYLGVRMYLSPQRLSADLRHLGARFALRRSELDLERFGFTADERPVLDALGEPISLAELDARVRDVEPRIAQAVVYALVAMDLCTATGVATAPLVKPEPVRETIEPPLREMIEPPRARTITLEPVPGRIAMGSTPPYLARGSAPRLAGGTAPPVTAPAARAAPLGRSAVGTDAPATAPAVSRTRSRRQTEIARGLITATQALIDRGADHFALFGLTPEASLDAVRSAFVRIACQLHPDKLPELDADEVREAQRVFGLVKTAFAVLTDPVRGPSYVASLRGGGPGPARARPPTAVERAQAGEAAYQRAMVALRRDDLARAIEELAEALELVPNHVDFAAMLGWARFCAASDRTAVAVETRRALQQAIHRSDRPEQAWFYLGRVDRMLGRDREALHHFRQVLALQPDHADAASEVRLLEARVDRRGTR